MTTGRWRDIAEIVALLAVVGSLLAVVAELRQTQAALTAQTYQARAFDAIALNLEMATNPELMMLSADFDPGSMTDVELRTATRLYTAFRIDLDNDHFQYQSGFLDEGFYSGSTVNEIKTFAPIWRKLGVREARAEFRAEVDRILSGD